jgi:transposase-like protein
MGAVIPFDPKIKAEVIEQVRNNGMRVSEAANKYNVNARTIYGWLKQGVVDGNRNLILENNRLKKENEQLYKLLGRATAEMQKSKN